MREPKVLGVGHIPSVGSYVLILEDLEPCRFASTKLYERRYEDVLRVVNFFSFLWDTAPKILFFFVLILDGNPSTAAHHFLPKSL